MPGVGGIHIGIPSGGGGAGFDPSYISGLVAWYDAAKGITKDGSNRVSGWACQVAGDSNKDLAQVTAGNQPLWSATGTSNNSKPALTFATARVDHMLSGTWGTALPSPSTIICAGRVTATGTANYAFMYDGLDTTNRQSIAWKGAAAQYEAYAGAALVTTGTRSLPNNAVTAAVHGASGKIYVTAKTAAASGSDGTSVLTGLVVGVAWPKTALYSMSGELWEIAAWNRALTQAEVEKLLDWYGAKFGLSIGA